jgi:hypothetical protein
MPPRPRFPLRLRPSPPSPALPIRRDRRGALQLLAVPARLPQQVLMLRH